MNIRIVSLLLPMLCALAGGCGTGDPVDTSALPHEDPRQRVDEAVKKIDSSDMTPDQKQAAAGYLRQGAADAEQIRESATHAGSGG